MTDLARYRYNVRTRPAEGLRVLGGFLLHLPDVLFSLRWVTFSPTFIEVWLSGTDRVVYRTYEDEPQDVAAMQEMLETDLSTLTVRQFQERWHLAE